MLDGYDRLAALISTYPEHAIFRRFGQLTIKCLLYKQAELTFLEHELEKHTKWDKDVPEKSELCRSWYDFVNADGDDDVLLHRKKVEELQTKIEAYRKYWPENESLPCG